MGSVGHEGEKGWNSEQPSLGLRETDPQGLLASLVEHGHTPKIIQGCIPETQEGVGRAKQQQQKIKVSTKGRAMVVDPPLSVLRLFPLFRKEN